MKYLAVTGALFIGLILAPLAVAQQELYKPPLGDIMGKIQLRHIKLWFAGKAGNWELATYEADEIKASLESAADLYRGIPVELVTNTADPIQAIREALEAKDSVAFAKGYSDLTAACNACHQGIGRSFIVMQRPTAPPPSPTSRLRHPSDRLPGQVFEWSHLGMSVAPESEGVTPGRATANGISGPLPLSIRQDDNNNPYGLRNFLRLPATDANDPDIEPPPDQAA